MPLAQKADDFVESIGVNVHLHYLDTAYGSFTTLKSSLGECGVRYVRDVSIYNGLAAPDTQWIDDLQKTRFADLYNTHGIKVNMVFESRYADRQYWVQKVEALDEAIVAAEGINEVDIGSSYAAAVEQQGWLYDDVNELVTVQGPSWVSWNQTLSNNIRNDVAPNCDEGNFHPYSWKIGPTQPGDPAYAIAGFISNWTDAFDGKILVATEEGWPTSTTGRGETDTVQAKYASRTFLENFSRGVKRTFWYEYCDQKNLPANDENNFGWVEYNFTPKLSFNAVKNLITLLEEPGSSFTASSFDYSLTGETTYVGELLLQKSDGSFCILLWNRQGDGPYGRSTDNDVTRAVTVNLPSSLATTVYLTNNSTTPVEVNEASTSIDVDVPDHPMLIVVEPLEGPITVSSNITPTGIVGTDNQDIILTGDIGLSGSYKTADISTGILYEIQEASTHVDSGALYMYVVFWENLDAYNASEDPILINDFIIHNPTTDRAIAVIERYVARAIARGDDIAERIHYDSASLFGREDTAPTNCTDLRWEKRVIT